MLGSGMLQAQDLTAEQAVEQYISAFIGRINEIKPYYDGERERYYAEVEQALAAFVDFEMVARGVMGKYGGGAKGATEDQQQRFAKVFIRSMVHFYGNAMASYGTEGFQILETRPSSQPEKATNVRMRISGNDGSSFEVQYTMFVNENQVWKLRNLYLEGINLRRQYYSRFDDLMAGNDYDIDKVIAGWDVNEND